MSTASKKSDYMDDQVMSCPPVDVCCTLNTSKQTAAYSPSGNYPTSAELVNNSAKLIAVAAGAALRDQAAETAIAGDDHVTQVFPNTISLHCDEIKSEDMSIRDFSAAEAQGYINGRQQNIEAAAGDQYYAVDDLYPARPLKRLNCAVSGSGEGKTTELDDDQKEDEDGGSSCVTPTAREQRIPLETLVCPPAPKKRKAAVRYCKRIRRPNFYSHELFNYDQAIISTVWSPFSREFHDAESPAGAFLVVNPPDLHTLPESIKAIFKIH